MNQTRLVKKRSNLKTFIFRHKAIRRLEKMEKCQKHAITKIVSILLFLVKFKIIIASRKSNYNIKFRVLSTPPFSPMGRAGRPFRPF